MDPGARDTYEAQWWRALGVLRVVGMVYATGVYLRLDHLYAHPALGWLTLGAMAGWTAVIAVAQRRPAGRTWRWLVADLAAAALTIAVSRPLQGAALAESGATTLPVFWVVPAVVALALVHGWWAAVPAALVIGVANVVQRGTVTAALVHNTILVLLAGLMVGYVTALARRAEARAASALRQAGAAAERERLARAVHDGVLQVLGLVARRGQGADGDERELGRLAAEQERALRGLVTGVAPPGPRGGTDLRQLFADAAREGVSVATPATPVLLPTTTAAELRAAAGAALHNVHRHAGPGAQAFVLIEDLPQEVVVTVRDDGVGFGAGRLEEAATQGRLGVSASIVGRLVAIGGEAGCRSRPGHGVEVILRVPRSAAG